MKNPTPQQLSAISRLFSSTVFRELASRGQSSTFSRLYKLTKIDSNAFNHTVSDAFDNAFDILKCEGFRDEYIYRSAITQKILLGKHSLNSACMLTEYRAGQCKADLVILNGAAIAYEIKSERDSMSRLIKQLANYKKVFAAINVITSEPQLKSVLEKTPKEVGVLCLSKRFRIQTIRRSAFQPEKVCPVTIFDSLRVNEAKEVLNHLGVEVPNAPNTKIRSLMRDIFYGMPPEKVHHAMVTTLKRTRDLSPLKNLVSELPKSLQTAALSMKVNRKGQENLVAALSVPLNDALSWS